MLRMRPEAANITSLKVVLASTNETAVIETCLIYGEKVCQKEPSYSEKVSELEDIFDFSLQK